MHSSDEIKEPSASGHADSTSPPDGMTWWSGRWPVGGVNSVADLEWWVALRLEEMIDLQSDDSLAEIGRLLGVQALKNADRYLGLHGNGDHPRRPGDDQLQRVEDVEDALEEVLRYIGQQRSAAAVTSTQKLPVPTTPPPAPTATQAVSYNSAPAAIHAAEPLSLPTSGQSGSAQMDIDRDHFRVGWKGVWCDLEPGKCFLLIECLNRKPGKYYSPDELIAAAWDGELTETNTIQKWMSILRNHLEAAGVKGVIIRKNKHYKLILT